METPGAVLRRAREQCGMSIKELAAITRISPRLLNALEADDHDQFPAEVFIRGFLRSCAREVGLDPGELVALYNRQAGHVPMTPPSPEALETSDGDVGSLFRSRRLPRASYLITILAILLGLGLSILIFGSSEPERLSDSDSSSHTPWTFGAE